MRLNATVIILLCLLQKIKLSEPFLQSPTFPFALHRSLQERGNSRVTRRAAFNIIRDKYDDNNNDEEDDEEDEEEEEEDPYTKFANSEFKDKESSALSKLSASDIDWGGALGKLRQRVGDIESGKSKDPSNALFRLMSAKTPNQLIGTFVSSANPKVVKACSDAVNSLLGGLSNPVMGVETIVKTNAEKIGNLCFQLQMTGYMFRNAEYVLALKDLMNIKGSATLQDYKVCLSSIMGKKCLLRHHMSY